MRNRIIAGLCDAIIVVETAKSGGSMITANLGNGYNREIFALPGRVGDKYSEGCNQLIKTNRAQLFENPHEIAEMMNWGTIFKPKKSTQIPLNFDLSPLETSILDYIRNHPKCLRDDMIYDLNSLPGAISLPLMNLEMNGLIASLPGQRYDII
jgi:DNA processing protein